ncbi:MAG: macB 2, partial [Candidatus Solibacter sp.]|nr:macB 2 [Candidatus Solibacter sp.]
MQTTTQTAVVCRHVTKDFGSGENQVRVLRGVDLDVPFGEMTLLVGPSGCGKTTLLSVVAGLLNASSGEVSVLGENASRMSGGEAVEFRRRNIGFVFQQYNLLPALTAAENAAVPLFAAGVPKKRAVAAASELLAQLGLAERLHALPSQL